MKRRQFLKAIAASVALVLVERVPGLAFAVPEIERGRPKVGCAALSYIRQRLSEESFARQILLSPLAVSATSTRP